MTLLPPEGDGTGTVRLRRMAILRAVDNLISNAVRYGARAEVSVLLTDKTLRFRVEDDGPGIPEDLRTEAARPFSRLDPARNQDSGAAVLGWASPSQQTSPAPMVERCAWGRRTVLAVCGPILSSPDKGNSRVHHI